MNLRCFRSVSVFLMLALFFSAALFAANDTVFKQQQVTVRPSPDEARSLAIPAGEKVVDFDVWSTSPEAAVLVRGAADDYKVLFWDIASPQPQSAFDVPRDLEPRSIVCHPAARQIFMIARQGKQFVIERFQNQNDHWTANVVYKSDNELRRLAIAPHPFEIWPADSKTSSIQYRLFFGVRSGPAGYSVRSVTEEGIVDYQVLGPQATLTRFPNQDSPSEAVADSALPSGFHPSGETLLWEDSQHCFRELPYEGGAWGKVAPSSFGELCGGSVTFTPNGIGILHWLPHTPGVTLSTDKGKSKSQQAAEYMFASTPSSVPDGKGIIGLVEDGTNARLVYVPISVPLADVTNAWLFVSALQDQLLYTQHGGLLKQGSDDQLYQLYDTESYSEYGPSRPYLVTTDIFWEVFGAAYEGTFIVHERRGAMPAFWAFVEAARDALGASAPQSPWAAAFAAVANLRYGTVQENAETTRILNARGSALSSVTGKDFNYGELKPRGHYASDPQMARYFKAFRYLTQISNASRELDPAALATLPDDVKIQAMRWIESYREYIAPARAPLVWQGAPFAPPSYTRRPNKVATMFPLSWGFDNEILLSTVFHETWPPAEQVNDPHNRRVIPSGLDVAAALGSQFARSLLSEQLAKYPNLAGALDALAERSVKHLSISASNNLYDAWITALAVQWADNVSFPGMPGGSELWKTKRMQTGLASWATLRHATVLVNERTAAEMGEGGFEQMVFEPPRGYVEPDPRAFGAIADLFDRLAASIASSADFQKGEVPAEEGTPESNPEPLRQGILRRLRETANKARLFQSIAEKELHGEELTPQDYQEILYVGRIAEHHFLVFKSLANKDLALSTPDPMPKIADVAGGSAANGTVVPYLEAGVGRPMEWDQVIPFYGRREIVKGSVYSYYEFTSPALLDDTEWRAKADAQPHPEWVKPYIFTEGH
ncbi:MAG TPA: DUF3160 domain-containing protein [Terriglobales bacterium]|jgi:hypothetical protein|nr:DUF3160 domain-containing protein [Terriglobales bacterium]